jgi:hypothetical protein
MRALVVGLIGLLAASSESAFAQKNPAKLPAPGNEVRYFTSIDGLMDGNADVVLKETYQGKTVTSAVLDVCYPAAKGSDRKDRFVANLAVNGQNMTGTTQSVGDKLPVSVNLTRKPTGDTVEFKGQIRVGQTVTNVVSSDNSDLSEKEFLETQTSDDGISVAPKDFTEVSPEAVAVKVKLDSAEDFLKFLKTQDVEVSLGSLTVPCDALRSGQTTINLSVAPDRAAALVAKAKSLPGVVSAGWTSGLVDMERTIRFTASGWRDGANLNRDKLTATIGSVVANALSAKLASSQWSNETGKLTLVLKRPSDTFPALGLTDVIEVSALVAADKPASSDYLIVWVGSPSITTADESAGEKLKLVDNSADDDESDQSDDYGIVDALAKELKGQRWDLDKSVWK